MNTTYTSTESRYPYLTEVGLDNQLLLKPGSSDNTWSLQHKPKVGLYFNLLEYQVNTFPELSQREVGRAIFGIDPWMRESVNEKFPINAYCKITRLRKKNTDMDEFFPYSQGKERKHSSYKSGCKCTIYSISALWYIHEKWVWSKGSMACILNTLEYV